MSVPINVYDHELFLAHASPEGGHPERPERLVAAREGLDAALEGVDGVTRPEFGGVTPALAARLHAPSYLNVLGDLAGQAAWIDGDTYLAPRSGEIAGLAAGAAEHLGRALVVGEAERAVALLRPPGHHALPAHGMGFCLINNVAVAALAALDAGAAKVAIVDWDVHHGNGTEALFADDPRVLFVSLHQFPHYPGTGAPTAVGSARGKGTTWNLALPGGSGVERYAASFARLLPLVRAFAPDVILVSAGFDAHARDPLGGMELESAAFGGMARAVVELADELGHGRVGALLEGGYDLTALRDSVAALGRALVAPADAPELPSTPEDEALRARLDPAWEAATRLADWL